MLAGAPAAFCAIITDELEVTMPRKFRKHPDYVGRSLTLHLGRRFVTVKDHDELVGDEFLQFVARGFLVEVHEEPKKKLASIAKALSGKVSEKAESNAADEQDAPVQVNTADEKAKKARYSKKSSSRKKVSAKEAGVIKSHADKVAKALRSKK